MNLKEMRKKNNLTQNNVAKILKIHRTTLIRIEKGETSFKLEHLSILVKLYKVEEVELLKIYNENIGS